MKTCKKCLIEKHEDEFYKNASKCKPCTCEAVRSNRIKNIEYYKEFDNKRANIPSRVAARNEYAKTSRGIAAGNRAKVAHTQRYPYQRQVSAMVSNAVKSGKLVRLPCEVCGSTKRIHGHHDDYSEPFVVRWLCSKHHREWHKENGHGKNRTGPNTQ